MSSGKMVKNLVFRTVPHVSVFMDMIQIACEPDTLMVYVAHVGYNWGLSSHKWQGRVVILLLIWESSSVNNE